MKEQSIFEYYLLWSEVCLQLSNSQTCIDTGACDVRQNLYVIGNFTNLICAIQGPHIPNVNPGDADADLYMNRKSFRSLNVQVVCDGSCIITYAMARWQVVAMIQESLLKTDWEECVQEIVSMAIFWEIMEMTKVLPHILQKELLSKAAVENWWSL